MKRWIEEDWEFTIAVVQGRAEDCRLGIEKGDVFQCEYGCPEGFCPKTMPILYTYCEIARCGGDYRLRGSESANEIEFPCADGCMVYRLTAKHKGKV